MGKDLKPCPFCGSNDLDTSSLNEDYPPRCVECNICGCMSTWCFDKYSAIDAWNTRVDDKHILNLLERVDLEMGFALEYIESNVAMSDDNLKEYERVLNRLNKFIKHMKGDK